MAEIDPLSIRTRGISKSRKRDDSVTNRILALTQSIPKLARRVDSLHRSGRKVIQLVEKARIRVDESKASPTYFASYHLHASSFHAARSQFWTLVSELKVHREQLASLQATFKLCQAVEPASEECPICLEALFIPGTRIAQCGHMFHRRCILRHFARVAHSCPVCRQHIGISDLVLVRNGIPEKDGDGKDMKLITGMLEKKLKVVQVEMESVLERAAERED